VVDGLNSVLIPRERLPEDSGFQWHFASKIREGGRVAYTSDLLDALGMDLWQNGTSPVVPDDLLNKRCFLAWAEKSSIMVGTEAHCLANTIRESHAKESASMKYVQAYGLNLGGNANFLTFGATINLTPTSMPAFFKSSSCNGISDILTTESTQNSNHFVLVYDTGARIGWYIPQACVVLHMAHHYLSQQRLGLIDGENRPILLDYVEKGSTNAGATAAKILHHSLDYKTRRRTTSKRGHRQTGYGRASCMTGDDLDQFENTVERLWYLLDTVGSTLKMNRSEYLKSSESIPHGIHGVDFNELLEAKSTEKVTSIRYFRLDQPWTYLTYQQSTVLFCENFGHAIVPSPEELCWSWSRVPRNKDFLAMPGPAVHYFLRKNESGLSTELKWVLKKPMIQLHGRLMDRRSAFHTQLLKGKDNESLAKLKKKAGLIKSNATMSNFELIDEINPQSCLLFTDLPAKECSYELVLSPAQPTGAPVSFASQIPIHTKYHSHTEQMSENVPSTGTATITFSTIMNQPAASVAENRSQNWKGKQPMIYRDKNAYHERFSGSSCIVDTAEHSGEDRSQDEVQEEKCSKPQTSRNFPALSQVGEPVKGGGAGG